MNEIAFSIPGDAVAKGRPKASTIGGHVRMYTPAKTVSYESKVAYFANSAMSGRELFSTPVSMNLIISVKIPESWSNKKKQLARNGLIYPTVKPDCSNVLKSIEDGMNNVVYLDDKQIVDVSVSKRYSDTPMVEVVIEAV